MKQLNRFEMAAVKRTAKDVKSKNDKLAKINEKILALASEKASVEEEIAMWEHPIVSKWGYTSTQLLEMNGQIPENCVANEEYVEPSCSEYAEAADAQMN